MTEHQAVTGHCSSRRRGQVLRIRSQSSSAHQPIRGVYFHATRGKITFESGQDRAFERLLCLRIRRPHYAYNPYR